MSPVTVNGVSWLEGVANASNLATTLDNNNGATLAFAPASDVTVMANASARGVQIDLQNPSTAKPSSASAPGSTAIRVLT